MLCWSKWKILHVGLHTVFDTVLSHKQSLESYLYCIHLLYLTGPIDDIKEMSCFFIIKYTLPDNVLSNIPSDVACPPANDLLRYFEHLNLILSERARFHFGPFSLWCNASGLGARLSSWSHKLNSFFFPFKWWLSCSLSQVELDVCYIEMKNVLIEWLRVGTIHCFGGREGKNATFCLVCEQVFTVKKETKKKKQKTAFLLDQSDDLQTKPKKKKEKITFLKKLSINIIGNFVSKIWDKILQVPPKSFWLHFHTFLLITI